jgi:hypothetical protein
MFLHTGPPQPSDDFVDLFNEGFGKKNSGHLVNMDGG